MPKLTATERLRALLDERGAEWKAFDDFEQTTQWSTHNGAFVYWARERDDKLLVETTAPTKCSASCTPEQAIAATLGRGECHIKPWKMERDTGFYDCMECECGYVSDVSDWAKWHFCPNCGAKVVDGC